MPLRRPRPRPKLRPAPKRRNRRSQPDSGRPKVESTIAGASHPSGATQVEPNLYRYTDSDGKTWNYRQTPFGISKWEENSVPQAAPAKSEPVVVTDLGDSYRFEKKTPFGESTWIRKKSELTDEEIGLTQSPRAQSNPNQNRVDSKPAGNQ